MCAETTVIADASPVGLGAVLAQEEDGILRPISFASRALSDVEKRYSQTEKEALALVWACERFSIYLLGRPFTLVTDHKPLEVIYGSKGKPSARIERWVLRLQAYDFKVVYRPGKENIADVLSRLSTMASNTHIEKDEYVKFVVTQSTPGAMSAREIERASAKDKEIIRVHKAIQLEKREDAPIEYRHVWNELTVVGHVLLRGCRIVIPHDLRERVLKLAHEGHQGIVKCKDRLRSKVWWPGIDKAIERVCRTCHGCQVTQAPSRPPPMKRTELPKGPWVSIAADLMGPLPSGEYIFVVVDYYSRYFEIDILKSVKAEKIINSLEAMFTRYGVPYDIITDNGPQFVDQGFNRFLKCYGVEHKTSPPLWLRANGEVERQNRTLLRAMTIAQAEGRDWKEELKTFLLAYRTTPHSSTGVSPGKAFLQREIRCKLPAASSEEFLDGEMRDRDSREKEKGKMYGDQRAERDEITVGDKVLVQQPKRNKLTTTFETTPYDVTERTGSELTVKSGERTLKRRVSHTRPYEESEQEQTSETGSSPDSKQRNFPPEDGIRQQDDRTTKHNH